MTRSQTPASSRRRVQNGRSDISLSPWLSAPLENLSHKVSPERTPAAKRSAAFPRPRIPHPGPSPFLASDEWLTAPAPATPPAQDSERALRDSAASYSAPRLSPRSTPCTRLP